MYVTRVKLENIRCFANKDIDINFKNSELKPIMWNMFVGDNGEGKSTLIRSIAMGLCDESSAAGLLRELPGKIIRHNKKSAEITVNLVDPERDYYKHYQIVTTFTRIKSLEMVEQKLYWIFSDGLKREITDPASFPWDRIFLCGYGAGRGTEGTESYQQYKAVDAIYTLFRYEQDLQNAELSLRRLISPENHIKDKGSEKTYVDLKHSLKTILMLKNNEEIKLSKTGIEIIRPEGPIPMSANADGIKSIITVILDLLSWNMLYERILDPNIITGIVIIDEIEQHLHPKWQRYIVKLLHNQFPNIQFITTTHSPLCASGIADLEDNKCQIIRLYREKDRAKYNVLPSLLGFRADQVLTSAAFDVPMARDLRSEKKLMRFRQLFLKDDLTAIEKIEFKKLNEYLENNLPESAEMEKERKNQKDLRETLMYIKKKLDIKEND